MNVSAPYDVCFSYFHEDREAVVPFEKALSERGVSVFVDVDDLRAGENWPAHITRAVAGCRVFVLFLSGKAVRSTFVPKEVQLAYDHCKTIIPVQLDPDVSLPPAIQLAIAGQQRVMAARPVPEGAIRKLIDGVRAAGIAAPEPGPVVLLARAAGAAMAAGLSKLAGRANPPGEQTQDRPGSGNPNHG